MNSIRNHLTVSDNNSIEESGWTMYLDDHDSSFTNYSASSLISDAANSLFLNNSSNNNYKSFSKLNFKKRKTNVFVVDDSLEDTASSPVNSPKVSDHIKNQFSKYSKQREMDISQDKKKNNIGSGGQFDEGKNLSDFLRRENDNTELKKRGLCLVPLSLVENYFD